MNGAVTLQGTLFQEIFQTVWANTASPEHNSEDFHSELFPLHSPLLRESLLVSFPPPSYMLKFSGYSWLIGGPIGMISRFDSTSSFQRFTARVCFQSFNGPSTDVVSFLFVINWRSDVVFCGTGVATHTYISAWYVLKSRKRKGKHSNRLIITTNCFYVGMNRHSNRHTPRRKCKMRSKFWWLTGFRNSHDVSHFAAFFIVVGAKTSVAESVSFVFQIYWVTTEQAQLRPQILW